MSDLTDRLRYLYPSSAHVSVNDAAKLIDAIDALHERHMVTLTGPGSKEAPYCTCGDPWPCQTHLLIHPEG